ncbi:DNA-processing protein DprA [Sphingobacterium griseoflavum]|uniref:DNA processing protein DprA n=1 Tax=Sphingobacterium griseoflavum TaxID=1474952 RepID=A0ABQ3HR64_9SPHI|nr:DNA-processing protein DprA [Sphingobacterium griseoflavum]GHE23733.1 DNA processing protein DprA [Sphingobacterium griseoflavum]
MNKLQQIALTKIKGVGPKTARNLLAHCGSVDGIFRSKKKELLRIPQIGQTTVEAILSKNYLSDAEKELQFVEKHGIDLLWIEDENYPKRLLYCDDAPLLLYYKGSATLNPQRCVSIVGTRNATSYGKQLCEELLAAFQEQNILVVSGLAYGIDVHAHRQSLKHGVSTVAVLGHGLDMIYPAAHRDVASRMLADGGLITEFPSGTIPERNNFPARNRIIAGLSDVTIVVEAARKGGALITAEIANSYHRDVCAFPGRIDQEYSAGCNYLIKTNRAHLIRHAQDLFYLMDWKDSAKQGCAKQLQLLPTDMSTDQQRVYRLIQENETSNIDDIAQQLAWPMSKLAMVLLEMEMNNHIVALPGKTYKLL